MTAFLSDSAPQPRFEGLLGRQVADALREAILSGELPAGARINLNTYRERWRVSITPLRDAVKQLEADGLVNVRPRRGVFVAEIDRRVLDEIFQIRLALEPLIAELAAPHIPAGEIDRAVAAYRSVAALPEPERTRRADEVDFVVHELVLAHCPNERLQRIMRSLRSAVRWCMSTVVRSVPRAFEPSLAEHLDICAALAARDGAAAAAAMRAHLAATHRRTGAVLPPQPTVWR